MCYLDALKTHANFLARLIHIGIEAESLVRCDRCREGCCSYARKELEHKNRAGQQCWCRTSCHPSKLLLVSRGGKEGEGGRIEWSRWWWWRKEDELRVTCCSPKRPSVDDHRHKRAFASRVFTVIIATSGCILAHGCMSYNA